MLVSVNESWYKNSKICETILREDNKMNCAIDDRNQRNGQDPRTKLTEYITRFE